MNVPPAEDVVARIDKDELVRLTLDVCNFDSSGTNEGPVAQFVADWLHDEGFKVRKLGLCRLHRLPVRAEDIYAAL